MSKIAVDVVLIPADDIIQLAIDINRELSETVTEKHVLGATTAMPHITVLMGLVSKEQLPIVYEKLDALAAKISALSLKITGIKTLKSSDNKQFCWLEIEQSAELQALHEAAFAELRPMFTYDDARKEMFYSPPAANEVPRFWREGIAKNNVQEKYEPHLTLGWGKPQVTISPQRFTAAKLALGHVGNHGTCRNILWSAQLKMS